MSDSHGFGDSSKGLEDTALLDLVAQHDDQWALEAIYDRHIRVVHAYATTRVLDIEDADEISQDTFLTLWQKRRSVRLIGDSALPWLLVTCRNLASNRSRSLSARERHRADTNGLADHPTTEPSPEHAAELSELRMRVENSLAALPDTDRAVVTLCLVDGLSYADAAVRLGLSVGAVRNRLLRARGLLRTRLTSTKGMNTPSPTPISAPKTEAVPKLWGGTLPAPAPVTS